jgi:hypothetical protein
MMHKNVLSLILITFMAACGAPSEPEKKSAADAKTEAPPPVSYALGFFPRERSDDGLTWRWMGEEGVIRLRNTHRDMVLTIEGRVPQQLAQPPAINIEFNGEVLDTIAGAKGEVQRKYDVPAGKQTADEWSRLRITTDQTFVPHEKDPNSPDTRRLGFSVYDLLWEPK